MMTIPWPDDDHPLVVCVSVQALLAACQLTQASLCLRDVTHHHTGNGWSKPLFSSLKQIKYLMKLMKHACEGIGR